MLIDRLIYKVNLKANPNIGKHILSCYVITDNGMLQFIHLPSAKEASQDNYS